MPNPKGNPGNKGGGRKSAFQERQEADRLHGVMFEPQDFAALSKRIHTGKYSVFDMAVFKALEGNETMLKTMFNKAFPDGLKVEGNVIWSYESFLDALRKRKKDAETATG